MYCVSADGTALNRRFTFEQGFAVDFQSFLKQSPSKYFIQAMEDAEVIAVGYRALQMAYEKSKSWERLGRLLAEHGYIQVNERIELMQFSAPQQRYEYVMKTQPELLRRVPLSELSSYLGVRPESLSRLRKRLLRKKS